MPSNGGERSFHHRMRFQLASGPVRPALRAGRLVCLLAVLTACAGGGGPTDPDEPLDPSVRDILTAHLIDPLLLFHLPRRLSDPPRAAELEASLARLSGTVVSGNAPAVREALAAAARAVAAYRSAAGANEADRVPLAAIELYLAQGETMVTGQLQVLPLRDRATAPEAIQ